MLDSSIKRGKCPSLSMTLKNNEYINMIDICATQLRARTIRPRTRVFHSIHKNHTLTAHGGVVSEAHTLTTKQRFINQII